MMNGIKKAFTLTEVITVLVIIGALALILIPNMSNMIPDEHNVKYKKAFYTVQEIVSDIINDPSVCTGLDESGNLMSDDTDNTYLKSCQGTVRGVFLRKLNTIDDVLDEDIVTTNGMRWNIPATNFSDIETSVSILVSLDNKVPSTPSAANGVYEIIISVNGKVTPGGTQDESDLLLNSALD